MDKQHEIKQILQALKAKRMQLAASIDAPRAVAMELEHDIRNLRYALENAVKSLFGQDVVILTKDEINGSQV